MLIGSPPFQSRAFNSECVNDIVGKIKNGDFRMDGPEWTEVSSEAKRLIKG